jgi:hypothetical protein
MSIRIDFLLLFDDLADLGLCTQGAPRGRGAVPSSASVATFPQALASHSVCSTSLPCRCAAPVPPALIRLHWVHPSDQVPVLPRRTHSRTCTHTDTHTRKHSTSYVHNGTQSSLQACSPMVVRRKLCSSCLSAYKPLTDSSFLLPPRAPLSTPHMSPHSLA